jgi:glucan-binding YG repeat protein
VSAVGLSYYNPDGACLRVRDRAEIKLIDAFPPQPEDPEDPIPAGREYGTYAYPYEDSEGQMVKMGGKYYYEDCDGKHVYGFVLFPDSTLRYFDPALVKNEWINVKFNGPYEVDAAKADITVRAMADGRIAQDEIVRIWGSDYYLGKDYGLVKSAVFEYNGNKYFARKNGKIAKSDRCELDGDTYIPNSDGTLKRNEKCSLYLSEYILGDDCKVVKGFTTFEGDRYYCKANGRIAKYTMIHCGDDTYFAKSDGKLAVNETVTWYFKKFTFDENGLLVK